MAVKTNTVTTENIEANAREVDFVTRFQRDWKSLQDVLGIMRPIKKQLGTVLKSKYAVVTLADGNVAEGDEIPYSKVEIKTKNYEEMDLEKYAKGVTIESIKEHGYDVAVGMSDEEFLCELQGKVTDKFYDYLKTGTLTDEFVSFQMAAAMSQAKVIAKFKEMKRVATGIVGFCNILDAYKYLGTAEITTQTAFGMSYIQNFLGYDVLFLTTEVPEGTIISTAKENINLYYVDPGDADFDKAGLKYTVDGETNLIGFHVNGNYSHAVSESFALMGLTLFAEYIDAVAVITFTGAQATGE